MLNNDVLQIKYFETKPASPSKGIAGGLCPVLGLAGAKSDRHFLYSMYTIFAVAHF